MPKLNVPIALPFPMFAHTDTGMQAQDLQAVRKMPLDLNAEFLQSVLTFGAVVPPLTPYADLQQLLPGYTYQQTDEKIDLTSAEPNRIAAPDIPVRELIDQSLSTSLQFGRKPVVLFSGGVDSGVIAARLLAIGVTEASFVHYSFAADDPQTGLAKAMAKQLGIELTIIRASTSPSEKALQAISTFALPYADHAAIPAFDLGLQLKQLLGDIPHIIFDGTGADGVFGMHKSAHQWQTLYRIPRWIRHLIAQPYRLSTAMTPSRTERLTRLCRRSCQLPLPAAALAQNPLRGLLYDSRLSRRLSDRIQQWLAPVSGPSLQQQIIALDIALVGARIFAQKTAPMLRDAGHRVSLPFLDDTFFAYAMRTAHQHQQPTAKAELKAILAEHVDQALVYRSKAGFLEHRPRVFYQPWFSEWIDDAFKSQSPLSRLLIPSARAPVLTALHQKQTLPAQTYNALWAVAVLHGWIQHRP